MADVSSKSLLGGSGLAIGDWLATSRTTLATGERLIPITGQVVDGNTYPLLAAAVPLTKSISLITQSSINSSSNAGAMAGDYPNGIYYQIYSNTNATYPARRSNAGSAQFADISFTITGGTRITYDVACSSNGQVVYFVGSGHTGSFAQWFTVGSTNAWGSYTQADTNPYPSSGGHSKAHSVCCSSDGTRAFVGGYSALGTTATSGILKIRRTLDSGANWSEVKSVASTSSYSTYYVVDCSNDGMTALAVPSASHTTEKPQLTKDGGDTWTAITTDLDGLSGLSCKVSGDGNTLFIFNITAGAESSMVSTDGGLTWNAKSFGPMVGNRDGYVITQESTEISDDGSVIIVSIRQSDSSGAYGIYSYISGDKGNTWSDTWFRAVNSGLVTGTILTPDGSQFIVSSTSGSTQRDYYEGTIVENKKLPKLSTGVSWKIVADKA